MGVGDRKFMKGVQCLKKEGKRRLAPAGMQRFYTGEESDIY